MAQITRQNNHNSNNVNGINGNTININNNNSNHELAIGVDSNNISGNSDLWRECVAWLTRCKVLPIDHKANASNAEIRVLALALRDGVLLCNLVILLDETSMDPRDFTRTPQMAQFLCCKNIKLFIDVCRNHFGVRETDLFEPAMLYDLTNFHRVLITLSKLSQSPKVHQLHPKLVGFNVQLQPSERSNSDEAIYKDLHSTDRTNISGSLDTEFYDRTSHSGSISVEDDDSDITVENGTEDTEGYAEDNFSNMCDTIDDEIQSVNSNSSAMTLGSGSSRQSRHSGSSNFDGMRVSGTSAIMPSPQPESKEGVVLFADKAPITIPTGSVRAPSLAMTALGQSQNLQKVAAAAYNYQTIVLDDGHEYLNDFYFEEDEKIYEDLCYVTFSSKPPEV